MKKILIGFAMSFATLSFAQQYPNNGWGDDDGYYQDDGYYSDQDDQNYFPDDYYYNYPQDYYPQDYYQSNYNDYRNSIVSINWNVFFAQNRLSRWQIDQVLRLNNLYISFSAWNNFYRYNPDRWYYDRFYALERILGPRVFVVFRNDYYRGYSPVVYFQNYRRTHYASICRPMPRYRNVNINIYRVDRAKFRRMDNPTINIVRSQRPNNGFRGPVRDGNNGGGFRNQAEIRNNNPGFRNENNGIRNNGGFRGNNDNGGIRNNDGFRGERADNNGNGGGFRGGEMRRENAPRRENNGGGFRNEGGFKRNENAAPREQNRGHENRGNGGFRNGFAKN
ncbi:MAG: hypothetical protein DI622_10910 [Chryseobacterium sp.]|uniref:hypothetical protein n=1 Tax=unclassified Chryseobacterium TaxID=2593645 RepID=UPI000DB4D4EB|nr:MULTISPECIES: hypothetical protein [unclassified Chryseobacterium]MPS63278.1 hypothetical protein [Chryseobacterium sp.]PZU17193.1 MAG: hypothetical protein DI622_10910 [Chryseobacterium sp.]UMQ40121.1 hypothetical protein MKS83_11990 [Chryseobacterium sp. Y16C]